MASKNHWRIMTPPAITGRSGITHHFDFLAANGEERLGFDFYDKLDETEVIKTFIKKFDTGASACIVCQDKEIAQATGSLASEYGVRLLNPDSLTTAFKTAEVKQRSDRRTPLAA